MKEIKTVVIEKGLSEGVEQLMFDQKRAQVLRAGAIADRSLAKNHPVALHFTIVRRAGNAEISDDALNVVEVFESVPLLHSCDDFGFRNAQALDDLESRRTQALFFVNGISAHAALPFNEGKPDRSQLSAEHLKFR